MPVRDLSHDELHRLYGPWIPRTPADATELLAGYDGPWWIAGGWAIEAFTGVPRPHGDLDPSIPRHDLDRLRRHLAGRIDLWAADQETLQVLLPGDVGADTDLLPASCENVWARRSGADPWEYDIVLMQVVEDRWVFKRAHRITKPLDEITWAHNGIDYLRPEIQLLHKAAGLRPQDQQDFDATWPHLAQQDRRWLQDALVLVHPGHPWLRPV